MQGSKPIQSNNYNGESIPSTDKNEADSNSLKEYSEIIFQSKETTPLTRSQVQDATQKREIREQLALTPMGLSNSNGETINGTYSLPISPDRDVQQQESTGYQESLGKILVSLKEKSNAYELLLADLFTRILQFEKQVESLKVSLFRQEDVQQLKGNLDLMNVLFREVDRNSSTRLTASDLKWFVESHLTSLLSYPERFYDQLV